MSVQGGPDGWELAGSLRVARTPHGWALVGGDEDDGGVGLDVVVFHPESDDMVRRVRVRVPLRVDGDGNVVAGEVAVGRDPDLDVGGA